MEASSQQPKSEKSLAEEGQSSPTAPPEDVRITKNGIRVHRVTGKPIAILQIEGDSIGREESPEQNSSTR